MKKTVKNVAYKVLGTSLLASALVGCGAASQNSETKVTNGITITDSTYPSVVMLVMQLSEGQAICTGTFVNDSQVITAGHCVEGLSATAPAMYVVSQKDGKFTATAKAVSYKRNPNYNINLGVSPYDVSVVTFPANSAPATSALATTSPKAGQALTIVGFGNNVNSIDPSTGSQTGSGATTKRYGSNTIASVTGGFVNFDGLAAADGSTAGTDVSSGSGDSGGPLFVAGKLAATTSGGGLRSDGNGGYYSTSKYVDLNSQYVKSFLSSAVKR